MLRADQPADMTHAAALAFRDVSCVRGGRTLFEGLSFALPAGGAALVSGPNGIGKSSLIRVAAGLLRPVAGDVDGVSTRALMVESSALDRALPLAAALRFWAAFDADPKTARDRVDQAIDAVGLPHIADVPIRLLSTGQRRRAALARVVASGAALWLLDEPANGLDVASVGVLERLIAGHRAKGGALLVATHQAIALPDAIPVALG
jgi:heme exporter protein A